MAAAAAGAPKKDKGSNKPTIDKFGNLHTPDDSPIKVFRDAVRAGNYDKIKSLIWKHGQSLWTDVYHYSCMASGCGCAEEDNALDNLFSINTSDDNKTYNEEGIRFIHRLVDNKILLPSTINDEFVMKKIGELYGWIGDVAKSEALIKIIPKQRLVSMLDEYGQNLIHCVISSYASDEQTTALIDKLVDIGVSYRLPRKDGYTPFLLAVGKLNVTLMDKFRNGANVNQLINDEEYIVNPQTGKIKAMDNYINILHRICCRHAIAKTPKYIFELKHAFKILFEMGIDVNYVSTFGVSAGSYIVAYNMFPLLPISKDEFWDLFGNDKKKIKHLPKEGDDYQLQNFRKYSGSDEEHELDKQIHPLLSQLHKNRYKKDQETIDITIIMIKNKLATFYKDYLVDISGHIHNATHNLFGYGDITEIKAFFENS
jgi:hypothetical protein